MGNSFLENIKKGGVPTTDVLSCLANLSNDEVFTPPVIVNQMLDMLPQELFSDPTARFLDPACKTGVFLREIAKRLIIGLEPIYPDLQERIDHIFHEQLFGIAITELTSLISRRSLYCSKYPNGPYSVTHFDEPEGNIRFKTIKHTWIGDQCKYCGASKSEYDRSKEHETHAYEFIHNINLKEAFKMGFFDVIISNPPYQLSDGGSANGMSAKPIYQYFVENAKRLNPRYIAMIIPSRWFSGGKGLDGFRDAMLNDKRISNLVDYENYRDVFPGLSGLAGGACYFLWDSKYSGECTIVNKSCNKEITAIRKLNEFPVFIRSNISVSIVNKILDKHNGKFLDERISTRLPFGIPTTYSPVENGTPCHFTQRLGIKYVNPNDIIDNLNLKDKWKFLIPKAPIAGQTDFSKPVGFYYDGNTRIAKPGEVCSESWLVAGAFDTENEANNFKTYLLTKTARFLLMT